MDQTLTIHDETVRENGRYEHPTVAEFLSNGLSNVHGSNRPSPTLQTEHPPAKRNSSTSKMAFKATAFSISSYAVFAAARRNDQSRVWSRLELFRGEKEEVGGGNEFRTRVLPTWNPWMVLRRPNSFGFHLRRHRIPWKRRCSLHLHVRKFLRSVRHREGRTDVC